MSAKIACSLGASLNEATWVLTSYLVASAVILPISGWCSNRFGRKRFYMSCVVLFTTCSLLCGIAPTLPFLIVARVLQGLGVDVGEAALHGVAEVRAESGEHFAELLRDGCRVEGFAAVDTVGRVDDLPHLGDGLRAELAGDARRVDLGLDFED